MVNEARDDRQGRSAEQNKEELKKLLGQGDDAFLSMGFADAMEALEQSKEGYDIYVCSRSLKAACGYYGLSDGCYSLMNCLAFASAEPKKNTVCIIDDSLIRDIGNFETLKQLSAYDSKLTIIYLDRSQLDKQVKVYDRVLSSLRGTKAYISLKENVKNIIRPIKNGEQIIDNIHRFKDGFKRSLLNKGIFEEFNVDYIGPLRSKDTKELRKALDLASEKEYSVLVHCIVSTRNEAYLADLKHSSYMEESKDLKYARTIAGLTVKEEIARHRDILCVCCDDEDYGLNTITSTYPSRVCKTCSGIANALDYAFGLALKGRLVYMPAHASDLPQFYPILTGKIEDLHGPLIICLIDDDDRNLRLLDGLKNCIVYRCRDQKTIEDIIVSAADQERPTVMIIPDNCMAYKKDGASGKLEIGKWNELTDNGRGERYILCEGNDADIIARQIKGNSLPYSVIDTCFLNPLDEQILRQLLKTNAKIYLYRSSLKGKLLEYFNRNDFKGTVSIIDDGPVNVLFEKIERE